jgi:hypothetical protein
MSSMLPPMGGPPVDPPPPGLEESLMAQPPKAPGVKIERDPPEPEPARAALIEAWSERIKRAKTHWKPSFDRMRADQEFCRGRQWSKDKKDDRYIANLTLRLVQQRTAYLYAKNPKAVVKRRKRIENTVWDGTQAQLQEIAQTAQMGMQNPQVMMDPAMQPMIQQTMAIGQDALQVKETTDEIDKVGQTLELVYAYQVDSQLPPFKIMMKNLVRRTVTTGVGYVKLGFQRVMAASPDIEKRIADTASRLAEIERISADLADDVIDENEKEAEQLRLMVQDLKQTQDHVVHEGLTFDYPSATAIIPDPKTTFLPQFVGADWVCEEYILNPAEIQKIYGKDVSKKFNAYNRPDGGFDIQSFVTRRLSGDPGDDGKNGCACVWEIYSKVDGLVYVVCDGYPDFLREPGAPEIPLERFWPWFVLTFNQVDTDDDIYPPSDVALVRDQQTEYNRARQGLREHRVAARPKTLVSAGALDEDDLEKLGSHPNNAVLEIAGLQPGQKVQDLLQSWAGPGIDPNLYEVEPIYKDILRATGIQEANLGGTSDATATQAQIAESSRMTSMGANIDDLTDLLDSLAESGGQVLLMNITPETAQRIAGKGAVWPKLTRQEINDEIWLEIEAGSMGRPDQAAEVQRAEKIFPLLMQIPGINPEFLARELLKRLDDDLDLNQAFLPAMPSMVALNMAKPAAPGAGPVQGAAQGPAGGGNGAQPPGQAGSPPPDLAGAPPAPGGQSYQ